MQKNYSKQMILFQISTYLDPKYRNFLIKYYGNDISMIRKNNVEFMEK